MVDLLTDRPFAPTANKEILRRLQEFDPNLGFRHLPIGAGCWALTEKWGPDDPRRARIKSGELAPDKDFDVLGFAPEEATADDAVALLLNELRQKVKTQASYQGLLDKVIAHNTQRTEANKAPVKEFADEMALTNIKGGKIISYGAGFTKEGDKISGSPLKPKQGLTKSEKDARREWSDR
jgi:hypothetical protein